ncbi:hypothetical protein HNQ02_001224 [Flavobacterium sp. 7E]|uniref:energy transducer TonB n=1 Tax=unclassified Flavobacterium TaxID=196869 RepID=UPI00156F1513|nr:MULTISPECIES: energy transducer TonB [unclassified Flavobacterium]NRS88310.1 hypothetical protein [Flavobacterium sp. 7E]NRT15511.1 hypothetical protein [Flavobacterium sp. 28A]
MKNTILLAFFFLSLTFYAQKKVYFNEDFKELPTAQDATYYSTYEDTKKGTNRVTYYIDGTKRNSNQFSDIKKGIKNGKSEYWFKSGVKESAEFYVNNKLEGKQTRYYESGQLKRSENYKNNEFIDGKCFDENGTEITFFPYFVHPEYPGGLSAFYKHVSRNFKAPNEEKGRIKINFVVEKDGTITDCKIKQGINTAMNAEAIRVLKSSVLWTPGRVDGKDARVKFSIPITIR